MKKNILKNKQHVRSWQLRFIGVVAALLVIVFLFVSQHDSSSEHALWLLKGPSHYRMVVEYISPPAPPIIHEIVVKDGDIIQQDLLACDASSEYYSEASCETIQQYYSGVGVYTIEALFTKVDACAKETSTGSCTVEYDNDYGYPRTLVQYAPNGLDGTSAINIVSFESIDGDS